MQRSELQWFHSIRKMTVRMLAGQNESRLKMKKGPEGRYRLNFCSLTEHVNHLIQI